MLNRYGLFDIDKFLREQEAAQNEAPPPEAAAPPEDPNEKMDQAKDQAKSEDLVQFRKDHSDAIYRVVQGNKAVRQAGEDGASERVGRDTTLLDLKRKFASSGVGGSIIAAFDQSTTGLKGDAHIALLASLSNGKMGRGRIQFPSPGAAQEFASTVSEMRSDLDLVLDDNNPTIVSFHAAKAQPGDSQPAAEPAT